MGMEFLKGGCDLASQYVQGELHRLERWIESYSVRGKSLSVFGICFITFNFGKMGREPC